MSVRVSSPIETVLKLLIPCLFLLGLAAAGGAQIADDEPEGDEALRREIKKFTEEIEKEIEKREQQAGVAGTKLQEYRDELLAEYKRLVEPPQPDAQAADAQATNEPNTSDAPHSDAPHSDDVDQLRERRNLIRLQLWELERLEPNIESNIQSFADLQRKVSKFIVEHQPNVRAANGPIVRAEMQKLYQRVIDVSRRQRVARMRSPRGEIFYVVKPLGDEAEADASGADATQIAWIGDAARVEDTGWSEGPIQTIREPLRRILKLTWNEEKLAIDRDHWDQLFGGKNLETVSKIVRNQLAKRGVSLPPEPRNRFPRRVDPVALSLLLENLQYRATSVNNAAGSSGFSRSGDTSSIRFSNESFDVNVRVSNEQFELELREVSGANRTFRVRTTTAGAMRVSVFGEQTMFLDQKSDGRVVFFHAFDEGTQNETAASFTELYAKNPQLVERTIFPILEHFGFIPPPGRYSDVVVKRLVEALSTLEAETRTGFEQLLKDLDDAEFETREQASAKLHEEADRWIRYAQEALENQTLSLEVSTRLKRVVDAYNDRGLELDRLIEGLGLRNDKAYLESLLSKVDPESAAVIEQEISKF